MISNYQTQIILTVAILLIGLLVIKVYQSALAKFAKKKKISKTRKLVIQKFSKSVLVVIIVLAFIFIWGIKLNSLWVFTTSILGVIGIAFFTTWSYLSNIFAALVLFFTVPFKIGDKLTVMDKDDSVTGIVIDMTLFSVFLQNENEDSIIVPNNSIMQKTLVKHSASKETMAIH